mmetsp:Transcript_9479/g.38773  ORF Transcript_9479/g.38773 Transcript_9479/m.38773 type:complete len:97 (-) Transcript_9479:242-532(-)
MHLRSRRVRESAGVPSAGNDVLVAVSIACASPKSVMMAVPKLGRKYGIVDFGVARGQEACPLPPCYRHRLFPESAASSGSNAGTPSIAPLLASYVM